jgi:hypothetical protein
MSTRWLYDATRGGRVTAAASGPQGASFEIPPPVHGQAGGLARAETWPENIPGSKKGR